MNCTNNIAPTQDIVLETLKHRGVVDTTKYANAECDRFTDPQNLYNIQEINNLCAMVETGKHIGVLVDSDVDGYMGSALIMNYFNERYPMNRLELVIPDIKLHGIESNIEHLNGFDAIVAVDSSSNDTKALQMLENDCHVPVFVIDHHDIENPEQSMDFRIVSNQWDFNFSEINPHFTGVGMAYLCMKYLDNTVFHDDLADIYLDLVALGEIGDMEDFSDPEIRNLTMRGLSNQQNEMIRTFFCDDDEPVTPKHCQFTLIPKINSTTRIGTPEDRQAIMNALTGEGSESYDVDSYHIDPRTRKHIPYTKHLNASQYAIDRITKIKSKQDRMVNKAVDSLQYYTTPEDNMNVCLLNDKYDKGLSGLIANKLLGSTKKTTLVVKDNDNLLKGSLRAPVSVPKAKEDLQDLDGVKYALGHQQAAGIALYSNGLQNTLDEMNILFKDSGDYTYQVDKMYYNSTPSSKECKRVYDCLSLFGASVSEPLIGIRGLSININNVYIKNHFLRINVGGITVTQFSASDELIEQLQNALGPTITIDAVGTIGMNNWNGKSTPQMIVDDIEVVNNFSEKDIPTEALVF